jgi:hypothetical protein
VAGGGGGDGEGKLTNVQCKVIGNWHNESPWHNEYVLIKVKKKTIRKKNHTIHINNIFFFFLLLFPLPFQVSH